MRSKPPAKPIADLVKTVLRQLDLEGPARENQVFEVWPAVFGEDLARRARPVAIHQGRLVILVRDPAWMQELQFIKADLIKKLNRALGPRTIKEIRLKLGDFSDLPDTPRGAGDSAGATPPETPLDPALVAEAEAAVEVIKDPTLRATVLRALLGAARKTLRAPG